ncbi:MULTISPECIES: AAA family ATPase [unclassified Psychrobacter]|uniref:AAA family ATPase n=1 Tax=unclassified Psychrobacter TaxID=196806 RepID=UPI00071477E0|nr:MULTISPECIES: ATP-binding protein [unclassified Psychrobacter]KRG34610.1 nicotinate-nucleotide adenylyltransferase [Psychrobacter sp. P11F6]MBE8608803.1 ATP-binding protein [Pseudomonas lundensis]HCI77059.1 nicotinate-nucleotide adenylyltransferase [Psychrobacter sp.]
MNGNDVTACNLKQHTPKSVINVAILGAESTGKTTLCRDLAAHFGCPWVPEYMRTYLQAKWDKEHLTCTWEDLLPIAQGQIELENKLAAQAAQSDHNHYLFCDTSLFELMVYSNWYYGDCPKALTNAALTHHYDLILLTEVDIPWVADDLRDSPHQRDEISAYFESQLTRHQKPFHRIGGDRDERVQQVLEWLS